MISILGVGSPLNKFELIDIELSRNSKTVYVELTGSDLTGDGSMSKPFKTVGRALLEVVGTIRSLTVTIGAGVHKVQTFVLSNCYVTIDGAGSLDFDNILGSRLFNINDAKLRVDVDFLNSVSASIMASLSVNSYVYLYNTNVSLLGVTSLLLNNAGCNSYSTSGAAISSTEVCAKVSNGTNTLTVSLTESATTYTNIT